MQNAIHFWPRISLKVKTEKSFIETRFFHLNCFFSSLILSFRVCFSFLIYLYIFLFVTISIISVYFDGNISIKWANHSFDSICIFGSIDLKWNGDYWRKQKGKQSDKNELKKTNNNNNRTMEQSSVYSKDNNSWFTGWCFFIFFFLFHFTATPSIQAIWWKRRSRTRRGKKNSQIKCPLPFQMNYRQIKGRKF